MRIYVTHTTPGIACVPGADGPAVDPSRTVTYEAEHVYDMAASLAGVFVREGWGHEAGEESAEEQATAGDIRSPYPPMEAQQHPAQERETKVVAPDETKRESILVEEARIVYAVGEALGGGWYEILQDGVFVRKVQGRENARTYVNQLNA